MKKKDIDLLSGGETANGIDSEQKEEMVPFDDEYNEDPFARMLSFFKKNSPWTGAYSTSVLDGNSKVNHLELKLYIYMVGQIKSLFTKATGMTFEEAYREYIGEVDDEFPRMLDNFGLTDLQLNRSKKGKALDQLADILQSSPSQPKKHWWSR